MNYANDIQAAAQQLPEDENLHDQNLQPLLVDEPVQQAPNQQDAEKAKGNDKAEQHSMTELS